jgi:type I restriction enzyme S subunit
MSQLPEGWTVEPFRQVARYATGRTPARANSAYWKNGANQVPWVAISDMEEYGTITKTAEVVSEAAFHDVFRKRIVPAGTLLMSFKLTIGRVATLGVPACHNEAIISIYPRDGVDQRYLGYYLSQVDYSDHQDRQVKGNTLNQSKIDRIPILLPPDNEQRSIADVLDLCRAGLNTERAAEATATELKRATMRELFTRGLRGEAQKETEIGLVPESWDTASLGSLFSIVQGVSLKGNLSADSDGVPFLRTSNVYWRRIDLDTVSRMHIDATQITDRMLVKGDLLVCEGGEIGRSAVWDGENGVYTYQNHLHRLRPLDRDRVDPRFAMAWLEVGFCLRNVYEGAGNKTTIPNLSRARLAELRMPLPGIDEQREIVAILDALDRKIALHRRKRAVLEELFQSLLHKLMMGEIRVADLDLSALAQASEATA